MLGIRKSAASNEIARYSFREETALNEKMLFLRITG
jgi:hypothetical protein